MENGISSDEFEQYTILLIITLWKSCYPHEKLCFLLNKCFVISEGKSCWPPRKIIEELSELTLGELGQKVFEDYLSISNIPEDIIMACFEKILFLDMHFCVNEIIKKNDQNARVRWANILEKKVGETKLSDYFEQNPAANISNWMHQVKQRLNRFIFQENWLHRPLEDLLDELIKDLEK